LALVLLAVGAYHSLASLGWTELMARRLAAILAADVVGYSRLMAVDEARTHERLKALRQDFIEPKIAEHHGRVAKLMGDGALVRVRPRLVCAPPCHRTHHQGEQSCPHHRHRPPGVIFSPSRLPPAPPA
jgi:adenylate cyclase